MGIFKNLKRHSEDFYKESSDWLFDRYQSVSCWLVRSIKLNVVLLVISLLLAATILCLVPLREKVPYLYSFNQSTGEVSILGELKPSQIYTNWEMARFFIKRYVVNREMYDSDNLQYPYQIAWAMSGDRVKSDYDKFIFSNDAPSKIFGKDKFIDIHVLSVSKLNENTASVRFEKSLVDKNSGSKQVLQEEAIIKWSYEIKPKTQEMMDRDPLGFSVIYYHVSQVNLNT